MASRFLLGSILLATTACGGPSHGPGEALIGPEGGTVVSADGRAQLDVPAGALSSQVALQLTPGRDPPLDPAAVTGTAYTLGPDGVAFGAPARLRLGYAPALAPSGAAATELRVHRLVEGAWTLDGDAPENDDTGPTASATIDGTGTYALRRPDPAEPCDAPEDRLFDFWLGEWMFRQTRPVTSSGVNIITRDPTGCLILENFNGGRGRSISFYSRVDDRWHQTYIDTGGQRITMAGRFDGTRMQLYARADTRWTWELVSAGEIRYFGETMAAGNWLSSFDSSYIAR